MTYSVISENNRSTVGLLPDVELFMAEINQADFFAGGDGEIFVARAPGRLDVMGGIADYSGSLMLEMPIREATIAAVRKRPDRKLNLRSTTTDGQVSFLLSLDDLLHDGTPRAYRDAEEFFRNQGENSWSAYVAGIFLVLMREKSFSFEAGADIYISSAVPTGKGVSSSAAVEVAVMNAVSAAYEIELDPTELAVLCQITENRVVGAPCGVMDQMTSMCGRENELMALLCRPAKLLEPVAIPASIGFWGIDSGVRHAVSGADYGTVRTAAFIGYRIIAGIAGLKVMPEGDGRVGVEDPRWDGYLTAISPSEFARSYLPALPERISGADFLERFGGITDPVTQVRPDAEYPVAAATAHAVYENHRVHLFRALLRSEMSDDTLELLGELMFQAHASYAACGLTEDGTDLIVELVRERRADGVFGAKITGGGSGGTVAILARRESSPLIAEIAAEYEARSGRKSYIFSGSSPGAGQFGVLRLARG